MNKIKKVVNYIDGDDFFNDLEKIELVSNKMFLVLSITCFLYVIANVVMWGK